MSVLHVAADPESPTERAAHEVYGAVSEFAAATKNAATVDTAMRLAAMLSDLVEVLTEQHNAALNKADALCGRAN